MKNSFNKSSKFLALTLATTVGVTTFSPAMSAFASEKTRTSNVEEVITNQLSGDFDVEISHEGYNAKIKTLFADDNYAIYQVNENNVQYTIKYDLNNETATINDKTYKLEDILKASEIQMKNLNESIGVRIGDNSLIQIMESNFEPLTGYNNYSNLSNYNLKMPNPPTIGYKQEYFVGSYKKVNMGLALSTAALTAAATFLLRGNVALTKVFVTKVLKEAVAVGLISSMTGTYFTDTFYNKYQSLHSTTSAVKERRQPYTKVQNLNIYGDSSVWYFFSSKPF